MEHSHISLIYIHSECRCHFDLTFISHPNRTTSLASVQQFDCKRLLNFIRTTEYVYKCWMLILWINSFQIYLSIMYESTNFIECNILNACEFIWVGTPTQFRMKKASYSWQFIYRRVHPWAIVLYINMK